MPRKQMWVPLALLIASDVYLNRVTYAYPLSGDQFISWGFYAAIILLGGALIKGFSPWRIAAAALTGSVAFFLVSNFAVWAVYAMYPKTLSGLAACYAAGVPFFRNAFASDMLFTAAFFTIGYFASQRSAQGVPVPVVHRDR